MRLFFNDLFTSNILKSPHKSIFIKLFSSMFLLSGAPERLAEASESVNGALESVNGASESVNGASESVSGALERVSGALESTLKCYFAVLCVFSRLD